MTRKNKHERMPDRIIPMIKKERHGIPALLSCICPGLGQIVKGEIWKGIFFLFAYVISIILIFFIIGLFFVPVIWICSVHDAYNVQVED